MALTFSIVCLLSFVTLSQSCRILKVETGNAELEYLKDARFELNPTLLADGRPVYQEIRDDDQPKRLIHHYSHNTHELEDGQVDYNNIDFYGRWIIGGDIYSGNGWAFLSSWCIDPSHEMVESYINADIILNTEKYTEHQDNDQIAILENKDKWNVFLNNEWQRASLSDINVVCDEDSADDLLDWLFITFHNDTTVSWFRMNIDRDFNLNLHGFYYRIHDNYYRKVDTSIFLEIIDGSYRFFMYFGFTDSNGIPLFWDTHDGEEPGNIDPLQFYATGSSNNNGGLFPTTFSLIRNETQFQNMDDSHRGEIEIETVREEVEIEILYRTKKEETIYDVFRDYYNSIKNDSFHDSIKNSLVASGLITDSGSGSYLSSLMGGGSGSDGLSKEDAEMVDKVEYSLIEPLNNGMLFSLLGFGTGGLSGFENNRRVIEDIINVGYRVIDSGAAYDSETPIGDIVYGYQNNQTETKTRDDLYIVDKVWPTELGFLETQSDIYSSLDKLNTNYIDLYMIHWPRCMEHFSWMDCSQASGKHYLQTWQLMEKLYAEGRILSLGVSNWDFHLWEELVQANGCQIIPQVVQNYFDLAHQDWELLEYLESWGVVFQGYATYRGVSQAEIRQDSEPHYMEWRETLNNMAKEKSELYGIDVTGPQIMLRWLIDSHVGVIPRSGNADHYKDNWNLWGFELTEQEHEKLNTKSIEEIRKRLKAEL